jgi:death-on-curing protein
MISLTREQVILLHAQLIQETGGSEGIRDEGLLDSALHAPFQSYADVDTFPSIQQKAARLGFGLVKNHAFIDGNKRISTHAMLDLLIPSIA